MKPTEFWFWLMVDQWGRRRKSPCPYPAEEALRRDPTATRIEGTCEIRECPETAAERYALAPTNQHMTPHPSFLPKPRCVPAVQQLAAASGTATRDAGPASAGPGTAGRPLSRH